MGACVRVVLHVFLLTCGSACNHMFERVNMCGWARDAFFGLAFVLMCAALTSKKCCFVSPLADRSADVSCSLLSAGAQLWHSPTGMCWNRMAFDGSCASDVFQNSVLQYEYVHTKD